ncbi:hypothetical protein MKW98_011914 [Papaver atlanticum]|uniref:Uncharacterized protein n=1 Tax=Papaver atlanticum TaxID=357466 RepID=A0AAD4XS68_9MAGN|nr:hypothetical protein MKW98_011914 [Papaver atlanticum]
MRRNDVKAVVLTGEGGIFSGGFDISVFGLVHQTEDLSKLPDVSVDFVCNTIEDAKKPSVAAIEGHALGGGLELTMGCHGRIAAPKVQLGLLLKCCWEILDLVYVTCGVADSSKALRDVILGYFLFKGLVSFGSLAESRKVIQVAREQAKRTAPNMPQHQACLDAVKEGIVSGGYSCVLKEVKLFNELTLSDTSRGSLGFFFAQCDQRYLMLLISDSDLGL